jgi:hypothetical protein
MSFRRPTSKYKRHPLKTSVPPHPSHVASDCPVQSGSLISLLDVPRVKRPRHSNNLSVPGPEALVALPGRVNFTQSNPPFTNKRNSHEDREDQPSTPSHKSSSTPNSDSTPDIDSTPNNDSFSEALANDYIDPVPPTSVDDSDTKRAHHRRKSARQQSRWTNEVIPSILPIYLTLLRVTKSLREPSPYIRPVCTCGTTARSLSIICVYFERKSFTEVKHFAFVLNTLLGLVSTEIKACPCAPVAQQLVSQGLFPCAPFAPSLAVDITLLRFVSDLFVRLPPNMSSFTDTMETFLISRGYQLHGQVSVDVLDLFLSK